MLDKSLEFDLMDFKANLAAGSINQVIDFLNDGRCDLLSDQDLNSLFFSPSPFVSLFFLSAPQEILNIDLALTYYRRAAQKSPNCPELWNNIGMCFLNKRRPAITIACLKKVKQRAIPVVLIAGSPSNNFKRL